MFVAHTLLRGFVCSACRRASSAASLSFWSSASSRLARSSVATASGLSSLATTSPVEKSSPLGKASPSASHNPEPSVPWYLQTQASVPSPIQLAPVPDLPPNPPPLLDPLLQYLSVTAGLDDLALIDLRHLDPPPALGPKLIMIIGTARSEKHLHVAADRFCRYLRRDHGLKANAAGLLGRNELKIKLRRKAKRMNMLANVGGAVPEGNIDDGIRTGWICCTLGKMEAHPADTDMPGDNVEEFVGFRHVKPGVNVVVQMFTEEKRAETDLETLWGGVLKTHQRRDKSAEEVLRGLEEPFDEPEGIVEEDHLSDPPSHPSTTEQEQAPPSPSAASQYHRPRPSPGDMFPSA